MKNFDYFIVVNSKKLSGNHVTITKNNVITENSKSGSWYHVIAGLILVILSVIVFSCLSNNRPTIIKDSKFPVMLSEPDTTKLAAPEKTKTTNSINLEKELLLRNTMKEPYTIAERIYRLNSYLAENYRKLDSRQLIEIKKERDILINSYRAILSQLKAEKDAKLLEGK